MIRDFQEIDFSPVRVPPRRTLWLIFLSAAAVILAFSGSNGLLSSEESVAEGVRELISGRDIFAPGAWAFGDRAALWFCRGRSLPVMLIGGEGDFACRILSLIPALLLLAGTIYLAWKFFDRRAMYCAGWMLIGSYGFIYWSRNAGSFITLAAWVIWSIILLDGNKKVFIRRFGFFILFFSGIAFWGMNYLLTVPGVICLAVASGKFSPLKKSRRTSLLAAAAALPVVLGILAAAVSFSDITLTGCLFRIREQFAVSFLESWKIAVWNGQSFANSVHDLVNLPRMLFPWSLPALIVTAGMIRKWKELTPVHKKLLLGTILLFVCTGLFPGRRWQYQLCQLPLFLVITAGGICRIAGEELWVSWNDRIMKWGLALLCSFAVSVVVFWPLWDMVFYEDMPWSIIAGIPLLGLAGLGFLIFDTGSTSRVEMISGMRGSWSGYILAGVCFSTAVFAVGIPELGSYRTGKIFWQKCGAELKKNPAELLFYGRHPNAEAAYYMRLSGNCTTAADREMLNRQLLKLYENSQSCFVIVQEKDLPAFQEVIAAAGWRFDPVEALVVEGLPFHMAGKSDVDTSRNYFFCIKK